MVLTAAHLPRVDVVFSVHRLVIDCERTYDLAFHALFARISRELELEETCLRLWEQVVSRHGLVLLAGLLELHNRELKLKTLPVFVRLGQSFYSVAELDEPSPVRLSQRLKYFPEVLYDLIFCSIADQLCIATNKINIDELITAYPALHLFE